MKKITYLSVKDLVSFTGVRKGRVSSDLYIKVLDDTKQEYRIRLSRKNAIKLGQQIYKTLVK